MTVHPRQQGPPPEGSCGPVGGKGRGPELRGGVEREADCGAIVSLNIIRPTESEQQKDR